MATICLLVFQTVDNMLSHCKSTPIHITRITKSKSVATKQGWVSHQNRVKDSISEIEYTFTSIVTGIKLVAKGYIFLRILKPTLLRLKLFVWHWLSRWDGQATWILRRRGCCWSFFQSFFIRPDKQQAKAVMCMDNSVVRPVCPFGMLDHTRRLCCKSLGFRV
jgi:hypothetical protein